MKFRTISDDYVPSVGESFVPNSSLTDPTQAESLTNLISRFKRGDIRLNSSSGAYYETLGEDIPDEVIDNSSRRLNDYTDIINLVAPNSVEFATKQTNKKDDFLEAKNEASLKNESKEKVVGELANSTNSERN